MKAAETSVITVTQGNLILHMSIADKESNTGLVFNERLLVLSEDQFFGYISKFDVKKDDPKKIDLSQIKPKSKIPIKCIKSIEHDDENLSINFINLENNKQENKNWTFKFSNQEMVQKWVYLLQDQKSKRAARSAEKKSRSREGGNSLSSSKPNVILPKPIPISPQKNSPVVKYDVPQGQRMSAQHSQQQIMDVEDSQNREFVNPLYGYDSIQSDIPKKPVNNQKKPPEPKKSPEPIKPVIQPPSPRKDISISPKRENNFIRKEREEEKQIEKKQPQRSNLEFKNSPQKLRKEDQKLKSPANAQTSIFNSKPRESYVGMIQKIVKESEQRTFERMRERASYEQSIDSQDQSRTLYVNGVLEQFIRYDVGETQNWRKQHLKQEDWDFQGERSHNRLKELEELQQLALDLQKQQRNINIKQLSPRPVNHTDFSKEIALMLRNKRFERQGHDDLLPQKNPNQPTDIKAMPFSYRYLLATSPSIPVNQREEDMMDVLVDWKRHCEELMKNIVADMVADGGKFKMKTKKNNIMHFDVQEIQVKIALATLKTVPSQTKDSKNPGEKGKQKRQERISDYSSAKDLEVEFKNFCALNQFLEKSELPLKAVNESNGSSSVKSSANHSSRLKTPLTAVIEYCGFVAMFKLNSKFEYRQDKINETYIKEKQQVITQLTNIEVKWLQEGSTRGFKPNSDEEPTSIKTLILHVDENYYAQLHLQRGKLLNENKSQKLTYDQRLVEAKRIFDIDVLQEIDSFLLKDYLTKSLSNGILRKELIDEMIPREEYKKTIFANPQNTANPSVKSKLIADLTLFSGEVLQKLSTLILKLNNMSFYYLHPEEISGLFHSEGVNVRYMGLAYDNLSEVYSKKCLMAEITARVTKLLLRKTLQQVLLEGQQPSDKLSSPVKSSRNKRQQSGQTDITYDVMDILNCLLGSSSESGALWSVLSEHAKFYFKCELNKEQIDPGYLITSLAYHCRLDINWKKLSHTGEVFKRQDFFRPDCLTGVKVQSKTYEPFSSKLYNDLQRIMGTRNSAIQFPKQQTFRRLVQELNLSSSPLPLSLDCLPASSMYSTLSIKQLLSEFAQPQTIKLASSSSNFGHLRVFCDLNQFPQKKSLSIKMWEIKWYLRLKKKEKYLRKFEELVNMLNKFHGDFSPALGELYEVFAHYHMTHGEYEDAITFAKSSLVNTLKICGTNHIKTAESYYNLSLCYLKANKPQDACNLLKKAKSIYESKQRETSEAYANINLKLGLIMLTKNDIKEAVALVTKALETYEEVQELQEQEQNYSTVKNDINWKLMFENEKTQCYETLVRCCELGTNKDTLTKNLKGLATKISQGFLSTIQQPSNLQKILRLILAPHLHALNGQQAAVYIDVISAMTTANPVDISPKTYNKAYSMIRGRIKDNTLVENIESYLENSSSICDYVLLNNVLDSWKPFEKQFERETINDFVSITEQFIYFLGEGYLTGVLREVIDAKNKK